MPLEAWQIVVTDNNYFHLGDVLNIDDLEVTIPISKPATCSFRIRLDNPMAQYVENGQGFIKFYRDGQITFYGPVVQVEEVGDRQAQSLVVNAVSPAWFFNRRLVGITPYNTLQPGTYDRAILAEDLLFLADIGFPTDIQHSSAFMSAAGTITNYDPGPFRPFMEVLTELSEGLDGFEWQVFPQDNYIEGGTPTQYIGTLVAEPVFGTVKPNVVFEFTDDGKGINNVESYRRLVNRDQQANRVWVPSPSPGGVHVSAEDLTSAGTWNLLEDVLRPDINDSTLRQDLADEHVRIRKTPKTTYEFTPHIDPNFTGRIPEFMIDFELGDTVRARAKHGGRLRFDIGVRVWALKFSYSRDGFERMTLVLMEENA